MPTRTRLQKLRQSSTLFTAQELLEQEELANPEQSFYRSVERNLPEDVYVEGMNNPYSRGTPDRYYESSGGILWAEYKFLKLPARTTTLITPCAGLSPLQRKWLTRAYHNGVKVVVIVGSKEGGTFLTTPESWNMKIPQSAYKITLVPPRDIAKLIVKELSNNETLPDRNRTRQVRK